VPKTPNGPQAIDNQCCSNRNRGSGVKVVMPRRIGDARGFFSEVWNARDFAAVGIDAAFVQDNHVRNPLKGTLRGVHYQVPPAAQGKLARVTREDDFRCCGRHPAGFPQLRAACGRGADRRQLVPAVDTALRGRGTALPMPRSEPLRLAGGQEGQAHPRRSRPQSRRAPALVLRIASCECQATRKRREIML
jgi:dTDP-4-dehydrorhamnose 3,5-epimerase